MRKRRCLAIWAVGAGLAGCATYRPLPLDSQPMSLSLTSAEVVELARLAREAGSSTGVTIDLTNGLNPDEAAVVAVVANPTLRAERSRLAVSSAQLVQAGILPNPQLSVSVEPVVGGNTAGTTTGSGVGIDWDVSSLVAHDAKVAAARKGMEAVRLDVSWKEWQVSSAARLAVIDLIAAREQLERATALDAALRVQAEALRSAYAQHVKTVVELGSAESASLAAHADVLAQQREIARQHAQLNRAIGVAPGHVFEPEASLRLPVGVDVPPLSTLIADIESRRIDLIALRRGYDAQEQTLRAAILGQFPKVSLGLNRASDTSDVHTFGLGVTVDLPLFDHNQGAVAEATATRQQLRDEYADRLFAARADVVAAVEEVGLLGREIAARESAAAAAERLTDVYRKAAEARNADVSAYYVALADSAQKRSDVVKLKQSLAQSVVALELAAGVTIPGVVVSVGDVRGPSTRERSEGDK